MRSDVRGSEAEARRAIVRVCHEIYQRGLISAGDGNVSVRIAPDRLVVTPSGAHKGWLSDEDLVLCDANGGVVRGGGKASSEIRMHVEAYRRRQDISAVIHAHPATAIACTIAGVPLSRLVVPEVIFGCGTIATAPYTTPTTQIVPDTVGPFFECYDVVMMARHGSITLGPTVEAAFMKLDALEHTARIAATAMVLGGGPALAGDEVERIYRVAESGGAHYRFREGRACPPVEPDATDRRSGSADAALVEAVLARLGGRS